MNLADDIGTADDEVIEAVLILFAAVIRGCEFVVLYAGAHSAVKDDDMVCDGIQVAMVAECCGRRFHGEHDNIGLLSSVDLVNPRPCPPFGPLLDRRRISAAMECTSSFL